jgi:hypothetical protein
MRVVPERGMPTMKIGRGALAGGATSGKRSHNSTML